MKNKWRSASVLTQYQNERTVNAARRASSGTATSTAKTITTSFCGFRGGLQIESSALPAGERVLYSELEIWCVEEENEGDFE